MAEPTRAPRERVLAGLAGFATAVVAWPVPVGAVLFVATRFDDGWGVLGLLVAALYGWFAIGAAAGVITAFVGGPANRAASGALATVGVAVAIYLVLALSVIIG